MIDIEGLGTGPDAAILTIAAQSFDPFGTGYYDRHYYARITLESQETRRIQDDTLAWWATQPEAQAEAFKNNLRVVLVQYLQQAVRSDRTTIANRLREAGHPELTIILND